MATCQHGRQFTKNLPRNMCHICYQIFKDLAPRSGAVTRAAVKKMAVRQVALTILT